MLNNEMKRLRMLNKQFENNKKLPINSPDILFTADYNFSKKHGINRVGDSGNLLLSYNKNNRSEKYIVKHYFSDCACNEFVYSKLANAMGIKVPYVKLFSISPGEKRRYFHTEYIAGIEYLNIVKEFVNFDFIRNNEVSNWQDFFKYKALYNLLAELDSFEVVLTADNYIYKIDNTASFRISYYSIDTLGIDVDFEGLNIKAKTAEQILKQLQMYKENPSLFNFDYDYELISERYGKEYLKYYLQPFYDIQDIKKDYIDSFLNTLCYIYPDFLGEYYRQYIDIIKLRAKEYLNSIKS